MQGEVDKSRGGKCRLAKVQKQAEVINRGRRDNKTRGWNALAGRRDRKSGSTEAMSRSQMTK